MGYSQEGYEKPLYNLLHATRYKSAEQIVRGRQCGPGFASRQPVPFDQAPNSAFQVSRSSPAVKKRSFMGKPFWPHWS